MASISNSDRHDALADLVEAGAGVTLAHGNGVTPLKHARQRGYDEMVGILEDGQ